MLGSTKEIIQLLAIAPIVIQLVVVLVQLFEAEGNGESKKKAVLDSVEMVYHAVSSTIILRVPLEFVLKVARPTIDIAVGFFNLVGTFKHAPETAPSPAPAEPAAQAPVSN